jgi:hypothetical protein
MTDDAWHAGTGRDHTSGKATTSWCPCTPWTDGCELSLATGDEADAVHTRLLPGLKGKEGRKEGSRGMDGNAVRTEDRIIKA